MGTGRVVEPVQCWITTNHIQRRPRTWPRWQERPLLSVGESPVSTTNDGGAFAEISNGLLRVTVARNSIDMNQKMKKAEWFLVLCGICIFILGLAVNEYIVAALCFPGASLTELRQPLRWMLRVLSIVLMLWAFVTIGLRNRAIIQKLNLLVFSLLLIAPLCTELVLRVSFQFEGSPTRNPRLYADWYSDDDYWKLHHRWVGLWQPSPNSIHPLLGWSQDPITTNNPLGLQPMTQKRLARDDRKKIIFYGDSYVAGRAPPPDEIPQYMDGKIASADVLHAGVGGFGTGQSYLMFRETYQLVDKPFIIMGVLTHDLDRAVLSVRTGWKPRFVVDESGELALTGVPVPSNQEQLFTSAPLDLHSFVLCGMRTWIRRWGSQGYYPRRQEKAIVNAAILDQIQRITKTEKLELLYVVFYTYPALRNTQWGEQFLKMQLDNRGIPYVDTKPILLEFCEKGERPIMDLYTEDGHHNAICNHLIGDAIVAHLNGLGYE